MTKRILVVEDDPALSQILRDNLLFEGFDVDCVADGQVAVTRCAASPPDLVVLDVMLPGMNGFEVCGRLQRKAGHVPVLMLTARGQKDDKLAVGRARTTITKPFDLDELRRV